jgi:hypothetical protein
MAAEQIRPGCWLVTYEPTLQSWPTLVGDLQPVPDRAALGLQLHRLLAVIRMLAKLLEASGLLMDRPHDDVDHVVTLIGEYLARGAEMPEELRAAFQDFLISCACGDSGVCHRCDGRKARCRACGGTAICPLCPRLAEHHERLAACLGFAVRSDIPQKSRPRRARGPRLARAA